MSFRISACTIAKNEEKNIARSIESYKNYVDEIIIVDTGSTDNTVNIAESLGAKVFNFEWINDFSAARNFAIEQATGDWILFLDADEWIKDNQGEKLQSIIKTAVNNELSAVSFRMYNLNDDGTIDDIIPSLRLFENKPNIRYIRKIHEHLINIETNKNLMSFKSEDLVLNHCGYADSISEKKLERNKVLLEKNYMEGNFQALDYFYIARENILKNPEYTEKFLNLLINDEEKMRDINKMAIANNIIDLKIKLFKAAENKYSFEEKIKILDEAIKTFPEDPAYYYFKYMILEEAGKLDELGLVKKAIELDKNYEKNISTNNNSFVKYKAEALYELGEAKLLDNDNLAAMNYFVESLMTGQLREEVLRDLMYIIDEQPTNEKIAFLNSILDVNNEENMKFIVQSLRLTKYNEIFLYYFVKLYKIFGEVNISLFTSMMNGKNYEEVAEKYLGLFLNGSDKRAVILVICAILAGELKEFYEKNKVYFSPVARKIMNAYFNDFSIEEITKLEEDLINDVITEILYVAPKSVIEKIKKTFNYSESLLRKIIGIYAKNKDYKELLAEINTFIERDLSDEFAGEVTAKLGVCFYKSNDFANAKMYFDQAINIGYLDVNVYKFYKKLIDKQIVNDEMKSKFNEYKYLLEKFIFANNYMLTENMDEMDSESCCKTIEEFDNMQELNVSETFKKVLFLYAIKALKNDKLYLAEEYYKILVRSNFELGKCYYNLGNIYNKLGNVELSYFCYEKAFKTSIEFPSEILPEEHRNKNYLYRMFEQQTISNCPICGAEGELESCYQYIEDENLSDDSLLIVKYRKCSKCSHVFAENFINNVNYLEEIKEKEQYIFNAYDLKEKIDEGSKLLLLDETNLIAEALKEDFDVEFLMSSFEKNTNLKALLENINKYEDRILVTVINNIDSTFNKVSTRPLWANVGVVNAYSKNSIKKLLQDNGYKNIRIYDSKFIPGKITIVAKI